MGGHDDHQGHAKTSISEEEIRKLLARAETQTFSEAPKYTADVCGGVPQTILAGRFENERARLGPEFTEADRQWRIKFLASQNLHPAEPFEMPRRKLNPFRRFYRYPLNIFEDYLTKYMIRPKAEIVRKLVGRSIMGYMLIIAGWYHLNYNVATWETSRGLRIHHTKEVVLPGDIRYPMPNPRTESWQHYDRAFHERKVFLDK